VERFDGADGRLAPLARAVQNGSVGRAEENASLMGVGFEFEEFSGEFGGVQADGEVLRAHVAAWKLIRAVERAIRASSEGFSASLMMARSVWKGRGWFLGVADRLIVRGVHGMSISQIITSPI